MKSPATLSAVSMNDSRAYCRELTRKAARNFYFGLMLLPEPKRSAMYALYAYMRLVDDIADEPDGRSVAQRRADLDSWRQMTHGAIAGEIPSSHPLWPAFVALIRDYQVPRELFDEMIAGQEQDLEPVDFETFAQLETYCYRVASVVGLASLQVWGFRPDPQIRQMAIDRGIALQLTNVLRDLQEDAQLGRTYLPAQELREFGIDPASILTTPASQWHPFLSRQVQRAQEYYHRSARLESLVSADSRPTLWAMTRIYHQLLEKIARDPGPLRSGRIRLNLFEKLMIAARAVTRPSSPA